MPNWIRSAGRWLLSMATVMLAFVAMLWGYYGALCNDALGWAVLIMLTFFVFALEFVLIAWALWLALTAGLALTPMPRRSRVALFFVLPPALAALAWGFAKLTGTTRGCVIGF
ncbi:MAG: hypothetical protein Q4G70_13805 [Pseudomonadota bacterium]|nr:hypothetical protein [Pseudomonadota bacterium]